MLTVALDRGGLWISVEDADAASLPALRPLDVTARRGRRLQMIAALVSRVGGWDSGSLGSRRDEACW
jgi:hypothetical protein